MKKLYFILLPLLLLLASGLIAQSTVNTTIGVKIVKGLTLTKTADLHFGTMSIPTAPVSVILSTSNNRIASSPNDITLLAQAPVSTNAAYTVNGSADATYAISLPANGLVTIHSGNNNMTVNSFTCSHGGFTGTLNNEGNDQFVLGATLQLEDGQAYGFYSGTFEIIVAYN
ncbi:MAG: DUF4402 domain-containing protein [Bacteroidota bacterium]